MLLLKIKLLILFSIRTTPCFLFISWDYHRFSITPIPHTKTTSKNWTKFASYWSEGIIKNMIPPVITINLIINSITPYIFDGGLSLNSEKTLSLSFISRFFSVLPFLSPHSFLFLLAIVPLVHFALPTALSLHWHK